MAAPSLPHRLRRWLRRRQSTLAAALLLTAIALLGWLSLRYPVTLDWTHAQRNSLSEASAQILRTLDGPIQVRAFVTQDTALRTRIRDLVSRYQRVNAAVTLTLINPDQVPDETRAAGVIVDGELVVSYAGRSARLDTLDEQSFTNALYRLSRGVDRQVYFITGHGERRPDGTANHDLGRFGQQLLARGIATPTLSLATAADVPADADAVVLADPRLPLFAHERVALRRYLAAGGHFLWLAEPNGSDALADLQRELGLEPLPGIVVDATTQQFGIQDPTFTLIAHYDSAHPVTRGFDVLTVFPRAMAFVPRNDEAWLAEPLFSTLDRAWNETGDLTGDVVYDPNADEQSGPLMIGAALSAVAPQTPAQRQQRLAVIGDADFLANVYLGNGGNLDLGLNVFNWLTGDDALLHIPPKTAPDRTLALSTRWQTVIGVGVLFVLPGLWLAIGAFIGWRRYHA